MKAANNRTGFPWVEAIAFGLGTLRLAPEFFWALTPRELAALLGAHRRHDAPPRSALDALIERYPDGGQR